MCWSTLIFGKVERPSIILHYHHRHHHHCISHSVVRNPLFLSFLSPERNVLQKLSEREVDHKLTYATTTSELKAAMVGQMKTVTGASEDRCIAILESKDYNLKASIETFYRS